MIISTANRHLSRPSLAIHNGQWLLVYVDAAGHTSVTDSQLVVCVSNDEGASWQEVVRLGGHVDSRPHHHRVLTAPNGDVLIWVFEGTPNGSGYNLAESYQWRLPSGADPATGWVDDWQLPQLTVNTIWGHDYAVVEGTIYTTTWDRHQQSPLIASADLWSSSDNGASWNWHSQIVSQAENGNECALWASVGGLLAGVRGPEVAPGGFRLRWFDWSWGPLTNGFPQVGWHQYPRGINYGSELILFGREQLGGAPLVEYCTLYRSADNGATWTGKRRLSGPHEDCALNDMLLKADGTFYCVGYTGNSSVARIESWIYNPNEVAMTSLIHHWPCDSGTLDAVGGSDGTLQSGAVLADDGERQHVSTPGTGSYMRVPSVSLPVDWTLAAWVKLPLSSNAGSNYRTLFRGTSKNHHVIVDANGKLGYFDNDYPGGGAARFRSSGYTLSGSGWKHIAATKTGNTVQYYVDGVAVGSPVTISSDADIYAVGNYQSGGQRFAQGFDDVRIYDGVLTAQEISDLVNGSPPPPPPPPPPPSTTWVPYSGSYPPSGNLRYTDGILEVEQ